MGSGIRVAADSLLRFASGLFQAAGISAVLWGPGDIGVAHRPDEFVEVADLEVCLALLARLGGHLAR